jgi:hypothetical protein
MNKLVTIALSAALLSTGCAMDEEVIGSADQAASSSTVVLSLADLSVIPDSWARLSRRSSSIWFSLKTTATPGDVYTTWVCGFDNPDQCAPAAGAFMLTPSCSYDELMAGQAGAFCQWGAGQVADASTGAVETSNTINSNYSGQIIINDGIDNYETAEVTLVLRSHGPVLGGEAGEDQLKLFDGGCPPNTCADQQAAVFPAP